MIIANYPMITMSLIGNIKSSFLSNYNLVNQSISSLLWWFSGLAGTAALIEIVNKTVISLGATYYRISVSVAFAFSAAIYLYRELRGYRLKSKGHYIGSIFLIAGATGLPMIITIFPPAAGITSNVLL